MVGTYFCLQISLRRVHIPVADRTKNEKNIPILEKAYIVIVEWTIAKINLLKLHVLIFLPTMKDEGENLGSVILGVIKFLKMDDFGQVDTAVSVAELLMWSP
jgi:hypothetical protein